MMLCEHDNYFIRLEFCTSRGQLQVELSYQLLRDQSQSFKSWNHVQKGVIIIIKSSLKKGSFSKTRQKPHHFIHLLNNDSFYLTMPFTQLVKLRWRLQGYTAVFLKLSMDSLHENHVRNLFKMLIQRVSGNKTPF